MNDVPHVPYFLVYIQIGSGNTLIINKISHSLTFSLDCKFSSAIRIEHILSLNVSYASLFVLLLLCYIYCVAEVVPINSENVSCSKILQIFTGDRTTNRLLHLQLCHIHLILVQRRAKCQFWLPTGPCMLDTGKQVPLPLKRVPPLLVT